MDGGVSLTSSSEMITGHAQPSEQDVDMFGHSASANVDIVLIYGLGLTACPASDLTERSCYESCPLQKDEQFIPWSGLAELLPPPKTEPYLCSNSKNNGCDLIAPLSLTYTYWNNFNIFAVW